MLNQNFWKYLEEQRKSGKLTRERAEMCQYDLSESLALLKEWVNHDTIDRASMVSECVKGWLHHHEVLRKK